VNDTMTESASAYDAASFEALRFHTAKRRFAAAMTRPVTTWSGALPPLLIGNRSCGRGLC
jgi:hypothetical protein